MSDFILPYWPVCLARGKTKTAFAHSTNQTASYADYYPISDLSYCSQKDNSRSTKKDKNRRELSNCVEIMHKI